jgi:hypothetical protein
MAAKQGCNQLMKNFFSQVLSLRLATPLVHNEAPTEANVIKSDSRNQFHHTQLVVPSFGLSSLLVNAFGFRQKNRAR